MKNREMMLHENRYLELVDRFNRFYGRVAKDQNESILQHISGATLLEVGCGFGQFVKQADTQIRAFGIDHDIDALRTGRKVFDIDLALSDSYSLCFRNQSIDTIVLRETAHHLDMHKALPEFARVSTKKLVIFEPNINFFVRLARKIIRHRDYEAPLKVLVRVLEDNGYEVQNVSFRDVLAFPLSGGLVGYELVPHIKWLERFILEFDHLLVKVLKYVGIERYFCWRYLIVARPRQERKC
jgi:SAM-dependent methyltransferase